MTTKLIKMTTKLMTNEELVENFQELNDVKKNTTTDEAKMEKDKKILGDMDNCSKWEVDESDFYSVRTDNDNITYYLPSYEQNKEERKEIKKSKKKKVEEELKPIDLLNFF